MAHSLSSSSPQNKSIKNFRILLSRRSGPRFSNLCYLNLFLPRFKLRSTQEEKTAIAKLGESQLCNLDFCRILIDTRSVTAKVTTIFHGLLLFSWIQLAFMSPPAIFTVFPFHRILWSISMRSISILKTLIPQLHTTTLYWTCSVETEVVHGAMS